MSITDDTTTFTVTPVDADATADEGPRTYTQEELDTRVRDALDLAREAHSRQEIELRSRIERAEQAHRDDISLIGESLQQEAANRSWCSEYDEVVQTINQRLTVELPTRERDYDVTVIARVTIRVQATDEDSARNAAAEIASNLESRVDGMGGVHTSSWESSHDYEVDEA